MKSKYIITASLAAMMASASCSDDWDSHYEPGHNGSGKTVYEMIKADPSLSRFAEMVDAAGYKTLLESSQTFTVFAPTNEALATVDMDDQTAVKRIVANHIARFNVSTATAPDKGVKMYNGKRFFFEGKAFGSAPIISADNIAGNGILHVISSQIPYFYNLREYMDTHESTTSIAEFIKRFDERRLDLEASRPISVNESGQTVYDSVMVDYNPVFEHSFLGLGSIACEDSVFTMIIPDNNAWQKAYDRISPYYNVYDADSKVSDSIRDVQTSLAILGDLVYRQRITDPASLSKVVSTSGSEITDVASLFSGTMPVEASNGMIYIAPSVNYDNTLTWNKEIEVEGENTVGRTPGAATTVNVRSVDSSHPLASEVSDMRYIEVTPTSPSRQPSVTISIPDVLSCEYDIYASFVPGNVADETVVDDRTRVQFTISYRGENGRQTSKKFNSQDFVTSPTEMTLIKVAEAFSFPTSNFYDRLWSMDESHSELDKSVTTTLLVSTNVSNAEFNRNELTRRFRLDRIILIPVKK